MLALAALALCALFGPFVNRQFIANLDLLREPPTSLRVTRVAEFESPASVEYDFDVSPAVRTLYLVMRTSAELNSPAGCKVVSKQVHYEISFLRGAAVMLDASAEPECFSFFLGEQDEWYQRHMTNAVDPYYQGRYFADTQFAQAFSAATQLPYPPQ